MSRWRYSPEWSIQPISLWLPPLVWAITWVISEIVQEHNDAKEDRK